MKTSARKTREFKKEIWRNYRRNRRDLPWRNTSDPYRILVSEVMLQQTQVERVMKKYPEFLGKFPDFAALAKAKVPQVLAAWQGMGYNRRALALKRTAEIVVGKYGGVLPCDVDELDSLPGIGRYTAGAVRAFAFNMPAVCLETNIRRVFIHFFFPRKKEVHDKEIARHIVSTLETKRPREWYWALMDYGAMLKGRVENPNRRSAHYRVQGKFAGSNRELRGKLVRLFLAKNGLTEEGIRKELGEPKARVEEGLADLFREGFIEKEGAEYRLRD